MNANLFIGICAEINLFVQQSVDLNYIIECKMMRAECLSFFLLVRSTNKTQQQVFLLHAMMLEALTLFDFIAQRSNLLFCRNDFCHDWRDIFVNFCVNYGFKLVAGQNLIFEHVV